MSNKQHKKYRINDLKKRDEHQQQQSQINLNGQSMKKSWLNNSAPNINSAHKKEQPSFSASSSSSHKGIHSLEEHLLVKIFSKMSTMDKLVAQFVCKKWQRIIQSSQNTYMLFNNIEINGNTGVPFLGVCRPAKINIDVPTLPPTTPAAPTHTSLNLARFFRSSAKQKSSLPPAPQQQQQQPLQNNLVSNCRQNSANVDQVLKFLFTKLLNRQTFPLCLCVESITIKNSNRLTDKGLELIAMYCPELKHISLRNCANLKNASVHKLVEMCNNIKFIDLTGCYNVSSLITSSTSSNVISSNVEVVAEAQPKPPLFDFKFNEFCKRIVGNGNSNATILNSQQKQKTLPKEINFNSSSYFYLQYVDLSYCLNVDDTCIRNVCKNCVFIKNLYLRRCRLITDMSLVYIAKYCTNLRELSLCECAQITDTGVKYLADERLVLSTNGMRSNTDSSDAAVIINEHSSMIDWQKVNSRKEEHLRNMRQMKAKFHIRYLSLAKCHLVTDKSMIYLCKAGYFEQIKYLNLKGCTLITDRFMKYFTCSHVLTNHLLSTNSSDFISNLNLTVPFNLKSLDMSKTLITDKTIEYLCRLVAIRPDYELSKLNLRACANITDCGVKLLSMNFPNLQNLNLVDCGGVTEKSLREIENNCRCCVIQHTIFTFC
jgi:F-box/leucine-rich repeat protein 7